MFQAGSIFTGLPLSLTGGVFGDDPPHAFTMDQFSKRNEAILERRMHAHLLTDQTARGGGNFSHRTNRIR
jgi:hypothetical protein